MMILPSFLRVALVFLLFSSAALAEDSPLEEQMETLEHAFKAVRKQVPDDSKKEAVLVQIEKMKKAAMESREFLPKTISRAPEKDRADLEEDYKMAMNGLIRHIKDLETAVRDGKKEEARSILAAIEESRRDGHASFRRKEKEEEKHKEKHENDD